MKVHYWMRRIAAPLAAVPVLGLAWLLLLGGREHRASYALPGTLITLGAELKRVDSSPATYERRIYLACSARLSRSLSFGMASESHSTINVYWISEKVRAVRSFGATAYLDVIACQIRPSTELKLDRARFLGAFDFAGRSNEWRFITASERAERKIDATSE